MEVGEHLGSGEDLGSRSTMAIVSLRSMSMKRMTGREVAHQREKGKVGLSDAGVALVCTQSRTHLFSEGRWKGVYYL